MRISRLLLLLLPAAAAAAGSCLLGGFDRGGPVGSAGGLVDAGSDTGAGGGGPGCSHAYPADPPGGLDGGVDIELTAAVRRVYLEQAPDGGPLGLDLDRACTCQGEAPSCVAPAGSSADAGCDLPGGRDNASATLFALLELVLGEDSLSGFYSDTAEAGSWSALLRVSEYNGQPDDEQVRFEWFVCPGFGPGDAGAVPSWDGEDEWPVASSSFALAADGGLGLPRYRDPKAWVAGGVLVAAMASSEIVLAGGASQIGLELSAGTVLAPLVAQDGRWTIRAGLITGRVSEEAIFRALGSFRSTLGTGLCTSDPFYPKIKEMLCAVRDIHSDVQGPTMPCDALSFGIGFDADPARVGEVISPPELPPGCDAATDPTSDRCEADGG